MIPSISSPSSESRVLGEFERNERDKETKKTEKTWRLGLDPGGLSGRVE